MSEEVCKSCGCERIHDNHMPDCPDHPRNVPITQFVLTCQLMTWRRFGAHYRAEVKMHGLELERAKANGEDPIEILFHTARRMIEVSMAEDHRDHDAEMSAIMKHYPPEDLPRTGTCSLHSKDEEKKGKDENT